ncbi:MAG: phosphotransferase [Calditrichaeota bacterium]|nr:phosphotransferase [Calditrichota bacterium]
MLAAGCWLLAAGYWLKQGRFSPDGATGGWILDAGCWMLVSGCWIVVERF